MAAACIATAACGGPGTAVGPGAADASSFTGAWRLVEARGPSGAVPLIAGYRITLEITEGGLEGTAACNRYGGEVEIDGDSFRLRGGLYGTDMGCAPEVMRSEALYREAIATIDSIARVGDTLTLRGPETELRFERLRPPPTAQLVDTEWHLESLIEGDGPEGIATEAAPAHLVLKSDGTLAGSTGCRELSGEWTERGDEIVFTTFGVEGTCHPADLRRQDAHVVQVLGDGFTARIEEETLWVSKPEGPGLQYRAK